MGRKGHEEVAFKFLNIKNEVDRPRILYRFRREVSIL